MLDEVRSENAVIGLRRGIKAIESGNAVKVFVAADVAPNITRQILDACHKHNAPIELAESKLILGKACKIDVGASVVVITK